MKRLEVVTTARADIEETWAIEVTDRRAKAILAEPYMALDALAGNGIEATSYLVGEQVTGGEEDREVESVREVEAPGPLTETFQPDRPMPGWPMPNDTLDERTVVASVSYIADERGEVVLVLLLEPEAPYFTVAYYYVDDFDPNASEEAASMGGGIPYKAGTLDILGHFMNIVPAIRQYEQSGGDY